ncbi:CLUMA_CG001915, isoform A [Clunio marinus]|uniref:CLUMA_CG001915, isoform A n=1 Tax=Clunio marinus TaxID=568069 RepID=A0A1J1HKR9_9DIPT|nr:CLUMA_CG001915, isoform A [Clunio marinus]
MKLQAKKLRQVQETAKNKTVKVIEGFQFRPVSLHHFSQQHCLRRLQHVMKRTHTQKVINLHFPIDLSCVEKDHPFLEKDQLQALYRRLVVLNRSAAMRLDGQYNRNVNKIINRKLLPNHSLLHLSEITYHTCDFMNIRNDCNFLRSDFKSKLKTREKNEITVCSRMSMEKLQEMKLIN